MERTLPTRIHPLMAVAALSLTMVSLVGAASIAGLLPNSRAAGNDVPVPVAASVAPAIPAPAAQVTPAAQVVQAAPVQQPRQIVEHRTVVHHTYAPAKPTVRNDEIAQAPVQQAPAPAPVAQNSPVGIGLGAVVGGLIGNQVGGGKGRTLATIAGVVGGGYVGNEIAKKNQQQ
jgi:uncharacterized protein YcfJ